MTGLKARVLIVARDDEAAGPLADGLDRLGWRTVTARGPHVALASLNDLDIDVAIVDIASMGQDGLELPKRLKAACAPRRLPVIALSEPAAELHAHGFDLAMAGAVHATQTVARLESLVRLAIGEEEIALRTETFAARGRDLDRTDIDITPYRVLAIGEPTPQFLALSNALERGGADVVGAFTAYTAFDYLHERAFDAVVLWAGESGQEALSIAAGLRRNTRLFHIPALLYVREGASIVLSEVYNRGISDVALPETSEYATARRVIELAQFYRRQEAVRTALGKIRASGLMDASTGLFTRDLFAAHLARLAVAARSHNRPLSVAVLKIVAKPEHQPLRVGGYLDRAIPQVGSMIGRLVRAEDTGARLGPDVFALALPATTVHAAKVAADRIAAVVGCTGFEAGEGRSPFVLEFDIGVAEVAGPEQAAQALERAAAMAQKLKAS